MGNTGYKFLVSFFSVFICLITLVNYVGWSGGYLDLTQGSTMFDTNVWNNSYFGFRSIQMAVEEYKSVTAGDYFFGVRMFIKVLQSLGNSITLYIPNLIKNATDGFQWTDVLSLLAVLLNIIAQPLIIVAHLFLLLGYVIWYAIALLAVILKCFSGMYNIPLNNMPSPSEYQNFAQFGNVAYYNFGYLLV